MLTRCAGAEFGWLIRFRRQGFVRTDVLMCMHAALAIPRAPRVPSDLAALEAADPITHTLVYFAARKGRAAVAQAKAASTEPVTQLDA